MAAYKCTHCGEDIWGIAVPVGSRPLEYQHLACSIFLSKMEELQELYI